MKPLALTLSAMLCILLPFSVRSQQVVTDNWQQLQLLFSHQEPSYSETHINGEAFTNVTFDGYMPSAAIGAPSLPTFSRLIEVPLCTGFEVKVTEAEYDTIQLSGPKLMPTQPSPPMPSMVRKKPPSRP